MTKIKITATFEAEDDETDDDSATGLTEDAYVELSERLDEAGLTDVTIKRG